MPMRALAGLAAFGGCVVALASCSDPPPADLPCVTLKTDCMPLYDPPTYPTIYAKIFQPTCATGIGTCHTADSRKAGLYFQDASQAYQLLIGMADGRARVLPNNPGCSILAERLFSSDPAKRMPPGGGLSDAQLCDIAKWLAAGAPENP
jgi:hypothetical protein